MQRCNGHTSARTILDSVLDFWVDWQVVMLMLITMSLQLFLVLAGFVRKHTSNPVLHACVWVAFLSLDSCAAYALGLMLGSGCDYVFSLYAPILLLHLGAADAINAYAATDNDLWHRYGFKMALEIVAAAYLVSRSTDCPNFTASGVLLFVVGAFKYGERVFALRSGSQVQILASARPIYKYMALDHQNQKGPLIVSGEEEWYEMHNKGSKGEPVEKVTYQNVKECNILRNIMGHDITNQVCLAYALSKIFRRRLTNLRIYQRNEDYRTVENLLRELKSDEIRKVIDLELSFIFDGVFSKASAGRLYQGIGVINRLISTILLFAAAMELVRLDQTHLHCAEKARIPFTLGLAILLVIVALVIECVQLRKIMRSNWLRVWLTCNYITEERLANPAYSTGEVGERWIQLHVFNKRAILWAFSYVGKPRGSHWNFKLGQLSILVDSLNLARWHYLVQLQIDKLCDVQRLQQEITNLYTEITMDELQEHLVKKVVERYEQFKSFKDLCQLKGEILNHLGDEISNNIKLKLLFKKDAGLEDVILKCHLLTCGFELSLWKIKDTGDIRKSMDVKVSIGLSRYCMHLMLRRPKLMPEDPDVAKVLYTDVRQELKSLYIKKPYQDKDHAFWSPSDSETKTDLNNKECVQYAEHILGNMSGGGENEKETEKKIWSRLANVWLDILMYIVYAAENAFPHTEQMAKGGELLTHFWVLLGHLGPGQKSLGISG